MHQEHGESAQKRRTALCKNDHQQQQQQRGPVWPSGNALGWEAEGPRFDSASALLSLKKLWAVSTVFLRPCPSQLI